MEREQLVPEQRQWLVSDPWALGQACAASLLSMMCRE